MLGLAVWSQTHHYQVCPIVNNDLSRGNLGVDEEIDSIFKAKQCQKAFEKLKQN